MSDFDGMQPQQDSEYILDLANRTMTHLRKTQMVMARLLSVIGAFHTIARKYDKRLPTDYMNECLPWLDSELLVIQDLSGAIKDMADDSSAMAKVMQGITRQ